jgi:hypothetical protein
MREKSSYAGPQTLLVALYYYNFKNWILNVFFLQKLLELEDVTEEENKGLQAKVESLESIVRMLELKAKNATDHGNYSS